MCNWYSHPGYLPKSQGRVCLGQKGTMQLAQTILVTSGKGRGGKIYRVGAVGGGLAQAGKRVLLLEMDSGLRGMDIMLGVQDETVYDLSDVLTRRCEPIKAMAACPYMQGLYLLPAPYDHCFIPDQGDLIRLTRGLAHHFDYLLVDTPAGLGRNFQAAAAVADRALLVVTLTHLCAGRYRKSLIRWRPSAWGYPPRYQQSDAPAGKDEDAPDLDAVIDGVGLQLIGVIPQENQVMEITAKGQPAQFHRLPSGVPPIWLGGSRGKYIPLAIG